MTRADTVDELVGNVTHAAAQLPGLGCHAVGSTEIERDLRMAAEVLDDLVTRLHVEQHRRTRSLFDAYDETGHLSA
jgi:hypothetical protein